MGRPPRSLRSRRAGLARPTRFAGAKQCFANSPLHPPRGAEGFLGAARRKSWRQPTRSLRSRGAGFARRTGFAGTKQCLAHSRLHPLVGARSALRES